jgi:cellulose synthase/poly-beta-1,6-N-acetylglucosamine synthase-like glycosyltransferase
MCWLPLILILPYFILILKIYTDLLKIRHFSSSSNPTTNISVIVACRNEQFRLPILFECISRQDYPKELFEVLIVDDNSTDRTFETVSEYSGSFKLSILKNVGRGKKEAIRTGVNASSGRLIITTDADCTIGKSWLKTIEAFFVKNNPDMIIGPVVLNEGRGLFGKFQELEYMGLQGITAGTVSSGNGIMCNGANLSFTREAYLNSTDNLHFELASGDDIFLLHSLKKETCSKILWLESPDAVVSTAASSTLLSFARQRTRWISKWHAYSDRYTILTGIFTLTAILAQLSSMIAVFFNLSFISIFLAVLILKSVPDFLILNNTIRRYGRKRVIFLFFPAELIYPVYVVVVFLISLISFPAGKN